MADLNQSLQNLLGDQEGLLAGAASGSLDSATMAQWLGRQGTRLAPKSARYGRRIDMQDALIALTGKGLNLEVEENRRRSETLGLLNKELARGDKEFASEQDTLNRNLFSSFADEAGGKARAGIRDLRTMLGGRGFGAGSGAAMGLGSRIALQQQSEVMRGRRDVALESAKRAALNRAQRRQFLGGIANVTNQSPSLLGLDTLTNVFDVRAAQASNEENIYAANKAGKRAATSALIGGGISTLANIGFG